VHLGDDSVVKAIVKTIVRGEIDQIHIKYALHVPKLQAIFFSISNLM
jgi:hypothetical protein